MKHSLKFFAALIFTTILATQLGAIEPSYLELPDYSCRVVLKFFGPLHSQDPKLQEWMTDGSYRSIHEAQVYIDSEVIGTKTLPRVGFYYSESRPSYSERDVGDEHFHKGHLRWYDGNTNWWYKEAKNFTDFVKFGDKTYFVYGVKMPLINDAAKRVQLIPYFVDAAGNKIYDHNIRRDVFQNYEINKLTPQYELTPEQLAALVIAQSHR